jgi:hypothetical protein
LLLPRLIPALIEQREPESQHGIDVFGFPMHAWPFEPCLHDELVATLHTGRRQSASPRHGRSDSPSDRGGSRK